MSDVKRPDILSYGGGVQSVAVCVLVATGWLPRPERIVYADTGREASSTMAYADAHVRPLLAKVGLEIETAPHSLSTVDLYGHNGDLLIPAFTDTGKLPTMCSNEWKQRPIMRYLRSRGYGPARPVRLWLGISVDELERAKPSNTQWVDRWFPLLFGVQFRRSDCLRTVADAGLPEPPRSSCWMCPHRSNAEWRALDANDLVRATELEGHIREKDAGLWLHRSKKPIAQAMSEAEDTTMDGCDSGFCLT